MAFRAGSKVCTNPPIAATKNQSEAHSHHRNAFTIFIHNFGSIQIIKNSLEIYHQYKFHFSINVYKSKNHQKVYNSQEQTQNMKMYQELSLFFEGSTNNFLIYLQVTNLCLDLTRITE